MSQLMKGLKSLSRNETIFALFLFAGYLKTGFGPLQEKMDLTMVFLGLSILTGVIELFKKKTLARGTGIHIYAYFLFFAVVAGSLLYSDSLGYGVDKTIRFLVITGWSYVGVFIFLRTEQNVKRFLSAILVIALIMVGYSLNELYMNLGKTKYLGFITAFGSSQLSLGRTVGIGIVILLCLYIYNPITALNRKVISLILLIPMLVSLLVSGSRTPAIAVVLIVFLLFITSVRLKGMILHVNKGVFYLSALLAMFGGIAAYLYTLGVFETIDKRIGELLNESGGGDSALGRLERYQTAFTMFKTNWLTGKGVGSFPIYFDGADIRDYPHNIFLEILSELGIFGLISFGILLFVCLYSALVVYRKHHTAFRPMQVSLLMLFLFMFINVNVSGDLNDNRLFFTTLAMLAASPFIYGTMRATAASPGKRNAEYPNRDAEVVAV